MGRRRPRRRAHGRAEREVALGFPRAARVRPAPTLSATLSHATAADAPADVVAWVAQQRLMAAYLTQGEQIELAVKPSRWHIALTSLPVLALAALAMAGSGAIGQALGLEGAQVLKLALAAAIARVGWATADWLGCLCLLTSRRVVWIQGVFRQHVSCVPFGEVAGLWLSQRRLERGLGLGTVIVVGLEEQITWPHLQDSELIEAKIRRHVARWQGGGGPGTFTGT